MRRPFPLAQAMEKHVMNGGIDAANEGYTRVRTRLGFEPVAHFREATSSADGSIWCLFAAFSMRLAPCAARTAPAGHSVSNQGKARR